MRFSATPRVGNFPKPHRIGRTRVDCCTLLLHQLRRPKVRYFEPEEGNDEGTLTDYIPVQGSPGSYVVRFTLYALNGTQLDQRNSASFILNLYGS